MSATFADQFKQAAGRMSRNLTHRANIRKALKGYEIKRDENKARFGSWDEARNAASSIKWEAINHLDKYLAEFADKLEARGVKVHWAPDATSARDYIAKVAEENSVKSIIKSKSMTTEEIHLNHTLEQRGFHVVESDLGEYIVQLNEEPPYHLVFPSMHLTRGEIKDLFERKVGPVSSDQPEELTYFVRKLMREKFLQADMGISGANFGVAETGMISITENEGNARLTTTFPKIHVAILGIEKIIPSLDDLALFLPMLATAGAGQALTCYNSMIGGPKQPGEVDGPEQMHVVLLDNRRTELLADAEQRDALHCIRCGACLNVCPIFRNAGGHSYGTTYQGPIGSVITPHLRGLKDWKHLSSASSLCGACTSACPVKIDLHHHLLHNRRNAVDVAPSELERLAYQMVYFVMQRPALWTLGLKLARIFQPLHKPIAGSVIDPMRVWTATRTAPAVAPKSFRELWKEHQP